MLKKSVNRSDIQVSYFDTYRFHEYFKNMFFKSETTPEIKGVTTD